MKPAHQFLSEAFLCTILIIALIYNVFLLINGPSGKRVLTIATADFAQTYENLEVLKGEERVLAQKARQLSGHAPNNDLLDERIRKLLNYAEKGEYILYTDHMDIYLGRDGL